MLTDWPKEALTSETMVYLKSILQEWCAQNGISILSEDGSEKARSLIDWYEFGVKDRDELLKLLSDEIDPATRTGASDMLVPRQAICDRAFQESLNAL